MRIAERNFFMGVSVCGRNPNSEAGERFIALMIAWFPIYELTRQLCADLLDEETLGGLCLNSGYGPGDGETCRKMAERFACWMEQNFVGHQIESKRVGITPDGTLKFYENPMPPSHDDYTLSRYSVGYAFLKRWVEFLQHCGGFEVR